MKKPKEPKKKKEGKKGKKDSHTNGIKKEVNFSNPLVKEDEALIDTLKEDADMEITIKVEVRI